VATCCPKGVMVRMASALMGPTEIRRSARRTFDGVFGPLHWDAVVMPAYWSSKLALEPRPAAVGRKATLKSMAAPAARVGGGEGREGLPESREKPKPRDAELRATQTI